MVSVILWFHCSYPDSKVVEMLIIMVEAGGGWLGCGILFLERREDIQTDRQIIVSEKSPTVVFL